VLEKVILWLNRLLGKDEELVSKEDVEVFMEE
jgi:hypothetical protein